MLRSCEKLGEDAQFKSKLAVIEKQTGQTLNLSQGKTSVMRGQTDESTVFINILPEPVAS